MKNEELAYGSNSIKLKNNKNQRRKTMLNQNSNPNQNSNQTQNTIEVIMTEEETNKYLNSFKEKMGYKDISLILKSEAPNNNDDNDKSNEESKEEIKRLKTIRNKLIEGIRIGIIFFDEENKVGGMQACLQSRA